MSVSRAHHNLVLSGFMGSGKTAVGRIAARLLHFKFVDTDSLIVQRAGRTIAEIFAAAGEAAFRALEKQVLVELAQSRQTVIATGGGMTANEENLKSLKRHALVVCLWATPEGIWQRVKGRQGRPLLQTANPRQSIQDLLAVRAPFYRQADVLIHTEFRSQYEVARQVIHAYQQARDHRP